MKLLMQHHTQILFPLLLVEVKSASFIPVIFTNSDILDSNSISTIYLDVEKEEDNYFSYS